MTENEAKEILAIHYEFLRESWKPYPGRKVLDAIRVAISSIDKIQQYRAIGTVEECREARERQKGKKPNITIGQTEEDKLACCPVCEGNLDWTYNGFWRKGNPKYCSKCGQSIDWSDG